MSNIVQVIDGLAVRVSVLEAELSSATDEFWLQAPTQVSTDVLPSSGGSFNGRAFTPSGVLTDGLTDSTKPWVKYALSTGAISEEIGPPSEPWGTNEIWRKKSDFAGAIYF